MAYPKWPIDKDLNIPKAVKRALKLLNDANLWRIEMWILDKTWKFYLIYQESNGLPQ